MSKKPFTTKQITQAFSQIEGRLTKISILVEIINPYFYEHIIVNAHPLNWIIVELIHHVYGQTTRCWFDETKGKYKTISVCEIYKQIKQSQRCKKFSSKQKTSLEDIGKSIEKTRKKYEKRLKNFADKYYAHNEIRTAKQHHKEYETLKISWEEITFLLKKAKSTINDLLKHWDGKEFHYSEGYYQYFREGFWNSIDHKILIPFKRKAKLKRKRKPTRIKKIKYKNIFQ